MLFSIYLSILIHFIIRTEDIIKTIENLRYRGTEFLNIPDAYYNQLRKRLKNSKVRVKEDIATLQKLKILIDYDDNGYLLQVGSQNCICINIYIFIYILCNWSLSCFYFILIDFHQAIARSTNSVYWVHSKKQSSRVWRRKFQSPVSMYRAWPSRERKSLTQEMIQ